MRVPEIIGVEIIGTRAPGITATDIALSMNFILKKKRNFCILRILWFWY